MKSAVVVALQVPDREKGPNGLTLERQCLPSMYVESFEGVLNINLRLTKTVRKSFVCVYCCGYEFSLKRTESFLVVKMFVECMFFI